MRPLRYAADGTTLGPNPDYDPSVMRRERYVAFGQGVSKAQATRWAYARLARDAVTPNVHGTVTLSADPVQGHRMMIRAGQNLRLRGYGGVDAGLRMHVVEVSREPDATVRLTVDARARDILELDAIMARRRDAVDPAQTILDARDGSADADASPWYSEPPAGVVPRTALYGGLWSVLGIPMGGWGTVVRTVLRTQSPAAPFAAIVFGRPVSSAFVLSKVGNPLAADASGWGRIAARVDALEDAGMLVAWGQEGQAMGYTPGQTSPSGGSGTLTGRFDEKATWDFATVNDGLVYLAVYAASSTFLTGHMFVNIPVDD